MPTPTTTKTRLLIDGDIVAFRAAAVAESKVFDPTGNFGRLFAHRPVAEACAENMIHDLRVAFKADVLEVYLSDPEDNWRLHVDPTYKKVREGTVDARPMLLGKMKDYLRERYGATHWAGLEADDVLSLRATEPLRLFDCPAPECVPQRQCAYPKSCSLGRTIVVGRDKDFKSIPGLHHAWGQDVGPGGKLLIREVSPWEADRWHLIQTLAGDRVDGFAGCPGIGMARAAQVIDNPVRLVPQPGVKTRGKDKGAEVMRWVQEPTRNYWAAIVSHYRKEGLGEKEALVTARLARLLRHGEYNRETGAVTLWVPEMLENR